MACPRIKFCGLTRAVDVEQALDLGVDYLGLVLAESSPRRVELDQAVELATLIRASAAPTQVVVLFRDADYEDARAAIDAICPDLVQFHGSESEAECAALARPYWKALGMAGSGLTEAALQRAYPGAEALLLDAHAPGAAGGTGQQLDLVRWPRIPRRLVLAGGLTPETINAAITQTRPYAVDVSSGIESAPGIKDAGRMRAFVQAVRSG